jgi:hypothetical protein
MWAFDGMAATVCRCSSDVCALGRSTFRWRSSSRRRPVDGTPATLGALPPHPRDLSLYAQSRMYAKMKSYEGFTEKRGEPCVTDSPPASGPVSALGLLPSRALSSEQALKHSTTHSLGRPQNMRQLLSLGQQQLP